MTSIDTMMRRTGGPGITRAVACIAALAGLLVLTACDGSGSTPRTDISVGDAYTEWRSDEPPIFLDVRSETEYRQGHIEGSIHIPHTEVARRIDELRARDESRVIVYCERGGRARVAEEALASAGGFEVQHMEGDMRGWRRSQLPVVRDGG